MRRRPTLVRPLLAAACAICLGGFHDPGATARDERELVRSLERLEAIRVAGREDYDRQIKALLAKAREPYARERAVATLTEIAIRRNETERVVGFLEDLAHTAEDESLRTTAYAHLELIRAYRPPPARGSLEVSVRGEIGKGRTVTLIATVTSTVDLEEEVLVGLSSLDGRIELLHRSEVQKVFLKAGKPRTVEFDLKLQETGHYFIPVTALLSFSRLDSEKLQTRGSLVVNESSGRFISDAAQPKEDRALPRLRLDSAAGPAPRQGAPVREIP